LENLKMRVLVAGAGGVVGKVLVPALAARGHKVLGLVHSEERASLVQSLGAQPVIADALDRTGIADCVQRFKPDAITHQLTALPASTDLRHFGKVFEQTNRLRTTGLDNLLAAARAVGVRRFVAQSFCGWPNERIGGPVKTEDDPLDAHSPEQFRSTLVALKHVEATMASATDVRGCALRYGGFYGPGTFISADGAMVRQVRRRLAPVVGNGAGVWSFLHVADLASATVAALEGDAVGTFNVADDDPAPVSVWLPALAEAVGAGKPFRLPAFIARLLLPEHLYVLMTDVRGGSNAKFKRTFGWQPQFASWRDGFQRGL
jgi:2-alkyl-3-oxoalkanoate reductase